MKTRLFLPLLALLGSTGFAGDPKPAAAPPAEVTGKATITIEVNGKKVVREVDLGKAAQTRAPDLTFTSTIDSILLGTPVKLRTWLGVMAEDLSADLRGQLPIAAGTGLLLREVYAGDPAAKAGLQKNDVLVRFDDQILTNPAQLYALILTRKEGDTVRLTYLRKGREASVDASLGTHPEDTGADKATLVRRLSLDLTGLPPSPDEVTRFVADQSPGAYDRLVSRLLSTHYYEAAAAKAGGLAGGVLKLAEGGTYNALVGSNTLNVTETPLVVERYAAVDKDGNLAISVVPNPVDADKNAIPNPGAGDAQKSTASAGPRPWLGVATEEPSEDVRSQLPIAAGTGLLIRSVIGNSPAAKAGLENNDMLLRLDDQILTNPQQLRTLLGTKKDGDTVRLTYLRKGQEASVQARIGMRAGDDSGPEGQNWNKLMINRLKSSPAGDGKGSYFLQDTSGVLLDKTAVNAQLRLLFTDEVFADANESLKQLEKSLRDAGVDEQVITETKKALADTTAALQKAAGDVDAARTDLQRELQKATEEIKRAVEKTWRTDQGTAPKPKPAPPAEKP